MIQINLKNDMFPGLVFLILFGVEVIFGGIFHEPLPFPLRLVWLGMAFLIRANFRSAVFWGGLGGIFKDSLSHGLLGLEGFSYLLSLAILHRILQNDPEASASRLSIDHSQWFFFLCIYYLSCNLSISIFCCIFRVLRV